MSNMYIPGRVSVIMPVYNGEKYIEYAIMSIMIQDYDNIELIIINDGSTDRTEEIVNDMLDGSKLDWIMYNTSGPSAYDPMTLGYTFFSGIARSTGEYFTIHSYDNISLHTRFGKLISVIGDNAAAYSCFMKLHGSDNESPFSRTDHMGAGGDPNVNLTRYAITNGSECITRVLTDTAIMRKDYYMRMRAYIPLWLNGGWDDELGIMLALFSMGNIVFLDEVLFLFRVNVEDNLVLDWNDRLSFLMGNHGYDMQDIMAGRYKYSIDRTIRYFQCISSRRAGCHE